MQTIHILEFNAQYNVARSLDNPTSLQRRLDRIASDLLASGLEDRFSHLSDGNDSAYIFIEQMDVNLTLDTSIGDDRTLASVWARSLHEGIVKTLSQDSSVIVFRDRSAFIASFLEDLMQGRAWDCWYYAEFSNLQSVSVGQAILNVLTLDGDVGRDALLELTQRDSLERLLTRLTDAEVEAIATQCLLPPSPTVILPNTCRRWIDGLRSLLSSGMALTSVIARDVTRLYLGLLRQQPELGPDVNLARFIQDILLLRQAVMGLGDRATFLAQLAANHWTEAARPLGRSPLQPLLRTLAREVAGTDLVGLLQDLQVDAPATPTQRLRTAFGGIFLLVGAIADLDLYTFLQTCPYPDSSGVPKANLLLWLMALQCLGVENLAQDRGDGGLLKFAGLGKAPELEWLADYGTQLTEEMHGAFGQALQAHCQRVLRQPDLFLYQRSLSSLPDPSEWLLLHAAPHSPIPDVSWDNMLGMISAIALQGFAARLGALAGSSPAYLSRNFLESEAEIWISEEIITIHFVTCPLQMVLKMAGFEHFRWSIPWLDNRQLILNFDG